MLKLTRSLDMGDVRMMLYLPRNVDLCSLMSLDVSHFSSFEIEVTKVNQIVKAVTVHLHN